MQETLRTTPLESALEALLFVSDEPVNLITLADILEEDPAIVQSALESLATQLADREAGIQLQEVAGGWRLYTHPAHHELLEKYVLSWDTRRLSQAALETLAIVAYGQPITRQGIASIRGVNSDSSVHSLVEKGLVRESGVAEAPGNPMTYSVSQSFLEKFGLRTTADLPPLEDFAPDDETARFLREGLSAHARFKVLEEEEGLELPGFELSELPEELGESMQEVMQSMLSNAFAEAAGAVDKIDFDALEFEE